MKRRQPPKIFKPAGTPFPEPVAIPIEDTLDLHSFPPAETASVVEEYIRQCHEARVLEVRIVHGKGTGVLRQTVRGVLGRSPLVLRFQDAPPESGGWGATLCLLKAKGER